MITSLDFLKIKLIINTFIINFINFLIISMTYVRGIRFDELFKKNLFFFHIYLIPRRYNAIFCIICVVSSSFFCLTFNFIIKELILFFWVASVVESILRKELF